MSLVLVALVLVLGVVLGIAAEQLRARWERARVNRRCDVAAARRVIGLLEAPRPRLPITVRWDGEAR